MKRSVFLAPFRRGVGRRIFTRYLLAGVIPLFFVAWLANHEMHRATKEQAYESLRLSAKSQAFDVLTRLTQIERAARQIEALHARDPTLAGWGQEILSEYFDTVALIHSDGNLTLLSGGFTPTSVPKVPANSTGTKPVLRYLSGGALEILLRSRESNDWFVGRIRPTAVWPHAELLPAATDICVFRTNTSTPLFCGGESQTSRPSELVAVDGNRLEDQRAGGTRTLAVAWPLFLGGQFDADELIFVAAQRADVALQSSADFRQVFFAAFFAVLLLTAYLSFKAIGQNLIPLKRLTRAARDFAAGNRQSRVSIESADEFGNLGEIFNTMADRLSSQITLLESASAVDRLILNGADLREICQSTCHLLKDITDSELTGVVALPRPGSRNDQFYASLVGGREAVVRLRSTHPEPAAETHIVAVDELEFDQVAEDLLEAELSHVALVPVCFDDVPFGQLYVGGHGAGFLSAGIREQLDNLAERLAVALSALDRKDELHRRANFDELTGLPNRQLSKERLAEMLSNEHSGAVLYLDLDHFKKINDVYGHSIGDSVLCQVAERIRNSISRYDFVARIGGDEFVVILDRVLDHAQISQVARKLIERLTDVNTVFDVDHYLGASIGIVVVPDDGNSVEVLMKNADAAMYRAKEAGRATFEFFNAKLNAEGRRKVELEKALRKAVDGSGLSLVYQPQFSAVDNSLRGVEVLMRWKHPTLGRISPGEFIPLAEESELIEQVGAWAIENACADIACMQDNGLEIKDVSINVSARQMTQAHFAKDLLGAAARHGLSPRTLTIEVTESTLAHNKDSVIALLKELRAAGMRVAIDDFGTGYSSLSYLQNLPFDIVKIDKSFVDRIEETDSSANICTTIIKMAHEMGKTVVAEGVETQNQLDFLKANGCEIIQGFLLSKPLSFDDLGTLVRQLDAQSQQRRSLKIL